MEILIPSYLDEYFVLLQKEHGITLSQGQKNWYYFKYRELGEDIKQEYPSTPDEAFMGSSEGFYYLKEINTIRTNGQITRVQHQPQLLTFTAWDLGYGDSTSIWFYQVLPSGSIHVIDCYENSGEGLQHYYNHLRSKSYTYGKHYLPHDAGAHDKASGLSYAEQARRLNLEVEVLTRYNPSKSTFITEIQRGRNLLVRCWFDEVKCAAGLKALENYRKKWNESMSTYTSEPVHDWASHFADSFRYMAQAIESNTNVAKDYKDEFRKAELLRRKRI